MSKTFVAIVGKKGKEFVLHTDVASRSSEFFRAAMNNDWKESQQKRVTLKELDAAHFEVYLQWLSTHDRSFLEDFTLRRLAELYVMGDFLVDSAFRVDTLTRFTSKAIDRHFHPSLDTVTFIWEHTPENCPLRQMTVEMYVTLSIALLAEKFGRDDESAPRAFIVDCLRRIGETNARAKVNLFRDERKRVLESRRDEVLKELVA